MPIGFFYAPPLFTYNGVTVYGVHVDDHSHNELRKGKFGYTKFCSDEGQDSFEINELDNFREGIPEMDLLKEAIEQGLLTNEGVKSKIPFPSKEAS